MAAENALTSIVNYLALPETGKASQAYYRSKLFVAPYSNNSLVSAAGPILSLLERLCLSPSLPPIETMRDNIEHELYAFYSKLSGAKYPNELILIARYLLAATIDEQLGKNYLRVYNETFEFKAFTPLTNDGAEPQKRFFEILNYIKERPNQYLDLIEMAYFCLIAGFEGEHHMKADGRQVLENYMDELYHIIQQHRFNKPQRLFQETPLPKVEKIDYKPTLIAAVIALSVVACAFFTSHVLLENKAKNVLFGHSQLALLDK